MAEKIQYASATVQRCPNCGATVRFDPERGLVVCDYCGSAWAPNEYELYQKGKKRAEQAPKERLTDAQIAERKLSDKKKLEERRARFKRSADMDPLPIYSCSACGATVLSEIQNAAMTCPYCRNNIVLTGKMSGTLKPDGIIPFKFNQKKIPDMVREYYHGAVYLPRRLVNEARVGKITGIYVPFWLYDCDVKGSFRQNYSRDLGGPNYAKRKGEYNQDYDFSMSFSNLPVDASKSMEDELMDSLEPFNMSELVDFDTRLLAGFVADRFDETSDKAQERCDDRVEATAISLVTDVPEDLIWARTKNKRVQTTVTRLQYVLFPVYYFNVKFKGKDYRFAVNGQTGKVAGYMPDYKRPARIQYILTLSGIFLGLMLLYFVLFFLL